MREDIEYYIGIILVGIVSTILIPLYAIFIGLIRIWTFLFDVVSFPYQCMMQYHNKSELNRAIKRISEQNKDN
jgi:hypothetical protein